MFIGNGLKAMVKVGGYANKKQSDMPVPMYQLPRSRRRRRRRFERHFEASVKSSKEPWFGPAKKCFSGKDGWVTTLVHSPTANLQLLLKHTDGKDTYQLIRTSLLDYASEVVVKGDMNSKIKFKKAKSAADQIKQFEQAAKDLVQLYDAFRAKAHDENGLKKSYLVSDELIAAGVFKKGVPIHCKCGKHKINILHGDEKSCLDFHTAIERLRGMVQL